MQKTSYVGINRSINTIKNISHFKEKYEYIDEIENLNELEKIPTMNKHDLKIILDSLRKDPSVINNYIFCSGGTIGSPQINLIPSHMFIEEITQHWKPLDEKDVLCNLFLSGKMWSAHYFYNKLGDYLAKEVLPLGPIEQSELSVWLDFIKENKVTALAGTPTTLKMLIKYTKANSVDISYIKKILWVGESFGEELQDLISSTIPDVEIWGLYGSTETWVIGYNTPHCHLDTFHVLPYQHLELLDNEISITSLHKDDVSITLRYLTGDSGQENSCNCKNSSKSIKVLGRIGKEFKFRGCLFDPEIFTSTLRNFVKEENYQLQIYSNEENKEILELKILDSELTTNLDEIKSHLSQQIFDLGHIVLNDKDALLVTRVDELTTNSRTYKTPKLIRIN